MRDYDFTFDLSMTYTKADFDAITDEEFEKTTEVLLYNRKGEKFHFIKPKVGEWTRTGRTNVYGGEELMCPFCGDRVIVQNIEYELYCRQCGALLGDRAKGEDNE